MPNAGIAESWTEENCPAVRWTIALAPQRGYACQPVLQGEQDEGLREPGDTSATGDVHPVLHIPPYPMIP